MSITELETMTQKRITVRLDAFKNEEAHDNDVIDYLNTVPELKGYSQELKDFVWTAWKHFELLNNDLIGVKGIEGFNAVVKQHILDGWYIDSLSDYPYIDHYTPMELAEMLVAGDRERSLEDIFMDLFLGEIEDKEVVDYLLDNGDEELVAYVKSEFI